MSETLSPETTVGVVGLGVIGAGVTRHLVASNYDVVVCDIDPEALKPFVELAETIQDPVLVGSKCDVIMVAVVNDEQVREVCEALVSSAGSGTAIVILSTVEIGTVVELAHEAERSQISVLDCGVSGGPVAAASGQLVCMVGGEPEALERVRPVMEVWSSLIIHTGTVGSGLAAKLARNIVQYGAWLAAYEGQVLAESYGIDLGQLAQAIRAADALSGGSAALMFRDTAAPLGRADDPRLRAAMQAAAGLARKDLNIALRLADHLELELPMTTLVESNCERIFGVGPGRERPTVDPEQLGAKPPGR